MAAEVREGLHVGCVQGVSDYLRMLIGVVGRTLPGLCNTKEKERVFKVGGEESRRMARAGRVIDATAILRGRL